VKKLILVAVLACFLLSCSSLTPGLFANEQAQRLRNSHSGPVAGLLYDSVKDLVFSWGDDGTIRIWDPDSGNPRGLLRSGHRPVLKIALHPARTQVAVLEAGEGGLPAALSVWDYEQGKQLFTVPVQEQVLCLDYSSLGSYLIYSRADYASMVVLDSRTGRRINYLNQGFGIVSFFVTSRNENNLMTYQPSGAINYWDLRTGKSLKKLSTSAGLSDVRISPNLRFMIGHNTGGLEVVDLLTGAVTDREVLAGVRELAFSSQGNEIVALRESGGATSLSRFYFNGKTLFRLALNNELPGSALCCLAYGKSSVYVADRESALYALRLDGGTELLARNSLLVLDDFAIQGDSMAVSTAERIIILTSDFFSSQQGRGTTLKQRVFVNPFSASAGLLFLSEEELLVWKKGDDASQPGRLVVMNSDSGRILRSSREGTFSTSLVQVEQNDYGLITVEKSGRCRILNPESFATIFEYDSPGMNRLIAAGEESLIGAKSSLGGLDRSPLLHINRLTGETVSLTDSSVFLYDLLFDPQTRGLYSLGVGRMAGETILRYRFGEALEKQRTIFTFKGEDLSADLTTDERGRLYSSLGWRSVQVWDGGRLYQLEPSLGIPRRLESSGHMVYALNRDSSLTVWDANSRRILLTFYLFVEREETGGHAWVALTARGEALASSLGRSYLAAAE
jgi:WD40 repeat protein